MKLMTKFNLILLLLFGAGGAAISQIAYSFLISNARRQVTDEAELMLASARAVREYTTSNLEPLLSHKLKSNPVFHPETVPAFSATTTFNKLRKHYPDYGYREAALNPTNPENRATDWEADVIRWLREHPDQRQLVGERDSAMGPLVYLAAPMRADMPCMECHSTPSVAPDSMLARYGTANGFGWKQSEIVAAQIISVPLSVPVQIATQAYHRLLLYLIVTLIVTIVAVDAAVYWLVIRPLKLLSRTADRVSTGEKDVAALPVKGNDEIAMVTAAFNRMQVSMAKAFKMLECEKS
jgi:HAMP domain-containing protein